MTGPVPEAAGPGPEAAGPVLEVAGLDVDIRLRRGAVHAVRDVSLRVAAGETVGIVGESGCGKSTLGLALAGLLPASAVARGSIRLGGRELVGLSESELRAVRGAEVGMVFQDPMTSLNPTQRIGAQVGETLRLQRGASREAARNAAADMLGLVGLPRPREQLDRFPHELSGGIVVGLEKPTGGEVRLGLPDGVARPDRDPLLRGPGGRDVPGLVRGYRAPGGTVPPARPPLHPGADRRGAGAGRGPGGAGARPSRASCPPRRPRRPGAGSGPAARRPSRCAPSRRRSCGRLVPGTRRRAISRSWSRWPGRVGTRPRRPHRPHREDPRERDGGGDAAGRGGAGRAGHRGRPGARRAPEPGPAGTGDRVLRRPGRRHRGTAVRMARRGGSPDAETALVAAARRMFGPDQNLRWDGPVSGDDFLSAELSEAALMTAVLSPAEFADWLDQVLPGVSAADWRPPAFSPDADDPGTVHLEGLLVSRAWCLDAIGRALPPSHPVAPAALAAADAHRARVAALRPGEGFGRSHWLPSFLLYLDEHLRR